jgi:amidophosphoribosyltransferase
VSHVYDITYGVVKPGDNLVALDDSIVRGTTLKQSILKILARTKPPRSSSARPRRRSATRIVMASTCRNSASSSPSRPRWRCTAAPDGSRCWTEIVYDECREELNGKPAADAVNRVQRVYEAFTDDEISAEISRMVYPGGHRWHGEVQVIFQTIENLRAAIKGDCGDWYFTGDYPTPGGYSMVNLAYIRWYEGVGGRSYDLPSIVGAGDEGTH